MGNIDINIQNKIIREKAYETLGFELKNHRWVHPSNKDRNIQKGRKSKETAKCYICGQRLNKSEMQLKTYKTSKKNVNGQRKSVILMKYRCRDNCNNIEK